MASGGRDLSGIAWKGKLNIEERDAVLLEKSSMPVPGVCRAVWLRYSKFTFRCELKVGTGGGAARGHTLDAVASL